LESPLYNIVIAAIRFDKDCYFYTDAQKKVALKKELGVKRLSVCAMFGESGYILFKAPLGVPIKGDNQRLVFSPGGRRLGCIFIDKLESAQILG